MEEEPTVEQLKEAIRRSVFRISLPQFSWARRIKIEAFSFC